MFFFLKNEEFEEELELQKEITNNRAEELETLRAKYQNSLDAIEELEKKVILNIDNISISN